MSLHKEHLPLILFDGVCNLCNASVDFVISRDKQHLFKFASLQSEIGQAWLRHFGKETATFDSFVLIDQNGNLFEQSTAALKTAVQLGGFWPLMGIFFIVPPFLRNAVYAMIAKNRYRWFGKKESCRLPTPKERSVLLG